MRAGKLDRTIVIERATVTVGAGGQQVPAWASLGALRAQLVQASTEEFIRGFGTSEETAIVFRTRFVAGITTADRVIHDGATHHIVEVKELGRREGLELRTIRRGP